MTFVTGDGALGYPDAGPYDAVVVTAAAPGAPPSLLHQLAVGGKMVIPIGDEGLQQLTVIDRAETGYRERDVAPCRFVPLISKDAFSE